MKSLFLKIFSSFFYIIFLTVLLSTGIEFMVTQKELPRLLTEIRARNMAQILGAAYSKEKGWESLADDILILSQDQSSQTKAPAMRIIIRDSTGRTVYNSFRDLSQTGSSPLVEGGSVNIHDLESQERVGSITAYVDKTYLEKETADYLLTLLKPRLFQGSLTLLVALLVAFFLSRSITSPITALTRGAEDISSKEKPALLPVHSQDELGRMSTAFNRMIHSLEVQRELRKSLINNVSHEILSPLNVIRLEARGILDGISSPPEGASRIISEVDRLKGLISDLDWLAETDGGEYKLNRELISLAPLIIREKDMWQFQAEAWGKKILLGPMPPDMPPVLADPLRFSQALGNLVENSLKYSAQGSSVEIGCELKKDEILIWVTDSGPGIDKEDQPHLFERFYRSDKARTPGKEGRGLGLAIVRQIMELHEGRVWFTSRPGEGSTFFMTVPRRNH